MLTGSGARYWAGHDFGLQLIPKMNRIKNLTASDFATWVFEQTVGARDSSRGLMNQHKSDRLRLGTASHSDIDLFFQMKWTHEKLGGRPRSEWEVLFTDGDAATGEVFTASNLRREHQKMRCVPDVVLRSKKDGMILIIERKTTNQQGARIPPDGWPNLKAQLWCYGWIDEWFESNDVLLVGQLWSHYAGGLNLNTAHLLWKRSDPQFHDICLQWFDQYGGKFVK